MTIHEATVAIKNIASKLGIITGDSTPPDAVLSLIQKQLEKIPYIPFPVAFATVDVALIDNNGLYLGRKPGQTQWQFPGGFVHPGEKYINAAIRELMEETCVDASSTAMLEIENIGSFFVPDARYENSPHKITTSFFVFQLSTEITTCTAGDDLEEVKHFTYDYLDTHYEKTIRPLHHQLYLALKAHLHNRL